MPKNDAMAAFGAKVATIPCGGNIDAAWMREVPSGGTPTP